VDWDEDRAHRWDTVAHSNAHVLAEAQCLIHIFLAVDQEKGTNKMEAEWDVIDKDARLQNLPK
jgi:hypothetical protein